jgi:hypothetical protein
MKMVHEIKNLKTIKFPPLRIHIRWAALSAVIGLLYLSGATFSTLLSVYLGYRVLRLVMRLSGLFLSVVFTVISIAILVLIISLIIF